MVATVQLLFIKVLVACVLWSKEQEFWTHETSNNNQAVGTMLIFNKMQ